MAGWVIASGRTLGILTCSALLLISATLGQTGGVSPPMRVPFIAGVEASVRQVASSPSASSTAAQAGDVRAPSPAPPPALPEPSSPGNLTTGRLGAVPQGSSGIALPDGQGFYFQKATPVRMSPVRLQIANAWVDAPVQPVGVTVDNEMETPDDFWEVGWYRHGVRPGDNGRAVIAGHLDSQDGAAVFFHIRDLEPGDQIRILLGGPDGERIFTVRETAQYPAAEAPVEHIFGPSDHPELVLITCDGDFEGADASYSDRFVVYADMVVTQEQANVEPSG